MSFEVPKSQSRPLDSTVRANLLQHLINVGQPNSADPLELGKIQLLEGVTKISSNEQISRCFNANGKPLSYPQLPGGHYLVACVDQWIEVNVFAIYSIEQMREMQALRGSANVNGINWCILQIPEELALALLSDRLRTTPA